MATVYVLNKDGHPIMPTKRCSHVRWLLKNNLAKAVNNKPFTIQLMYECSSIVQDVIVGIDPGRTNIGICAISSNDGRPLFAANVETRNKDISELMATRKMHRQKHRTKRRRCKRQRRARSNHTVIKNGMIQRILPQTVKPIICKFIKNKESRICNRKRPEGWLTPTANQLLQTHLNILAKISKLLPISKVCLEINKFAFMKLDDPTVKGIMFQNGPLKGYDSIKNAVNDFQNGKCLMCDAPIKHYHHIIPKHKHGSEVFGNRCGLCEYHHNMVHTDPKYKSILSKKVAGLKKRFNALGVLNQIIPHLVIRLEKEYPNNVYYTIGKATHDFRELYSIPKDHYLDAYCIACTAIDKVAVQIPKEVWTIKQFRRHDRMACKQEMVDRKYCLGKKVVAVNRHKRFEQITPSLEEYALSGGRIDDLTVKVHKPIYQRLDRISKGSLFLVNKNIKVLNNSKGFHNNKPDYYFFTDGSKTTPKHCKLLIQNTGLVFVSKKLFL